MSVTGTDLPVLVSVSCEVRANTLSKLRNSYPGYACFFRILVHGLMPAQSEPAMAR